MRILLINQYFPPDVSASAYILGELAEDLARDHEVWVLAGRPSYRGASDFHPRGVHVVHAWSTSFPRAGMPGRLANYLTYLASSQLRGLRMPKPDVVVTLTDPPMIGAVGLAAARRYRAPFVYVCQDIFPDVAEALGMIRSPAVAGAWRRLNRLLRSRADVIVAIGRDMVEKLTAEGVDADKVRLIRNWGEGAPLPPAERDKLRAASGWDGAFVVMHAGNLGLAQNPGRIVEAAERLQEPAPEVRIVFLGDGASRASLEHAVAHRGLANVSFLPYLPKAEAQRSMAAADVHVVSLAPGLRGCVAPTKVYGIMAAGRPFVAAVEVGTEPALIAEEHRCGVVVEPDHPETLADAILGLRNEDLDAMGDRGRRAFVERFDRPIGTDAYRRLLEETAVPR